MTPASPTYPGPRNGGDLGGDRTIPLEARSSPATPSGQGVAGPLTSRGGQLGLWALWQAMHEVETFVKAAWHACLFSALAASSIALAFS